MRLGFSSVDLLLTALALWYVVSWLMTGRDPAGLALMARALPYAVLYSGLRILLSIHGINRYVEWTVLVGLCAWGVAEAACGLWQALGRGVSRHALYAMTGHFSNPGPFGGFIACVMAVAFSLVFPLLRNKSSGSVPETVVKDDNCDKFGRFVPVLSKIESVAGCLAFAAGTLVLPASMSRAAWLGLVTALVIILLGDDGIRSWIRKHMSVVPLGVVVVAALVAGAFMLKRDSAVGRLHIWDIEARAVMARPLFGAGPGLGLGAYGDAQTAFFRDRLPDPSMADPESFSQLPAPSVADTGSFARLPMLLRTRVQAAGCPEYPFNEFLGIGMETGLPGLLLALSTVVLALLSLFRRRSPFAAGLLCWAVFACASYPLSVPRLCILMTIFLAASAVGQRGISAGLGNNLVRMILVVGTGLILCLAARPVARRVESTEIQRSVDYRRLFDDGHSLFQTGRCAESLEVLDRGARLSSDPMFDIIIGRDYEALGDFDNARDAYLRAHYMVPGRLYPLVRLMRLQVAAGQDMQALQTARTLLDLPVNQRHRTMQRLHDEAEATRDSLAALIDIYDYEGRE